MEISNMNPEICETGFEAVENIGDIPMDFTMSDVNTAAVERPHHLSTPFLPDGVNIIGNHVQEHIPKGLTPAQIQQEYFENLPDCDWIK